MVISLAQEFATMAFKMPDQVDSLHAAGSAKVSRITVGGSQKRFQQKSSNTQ
jgi:hypothetical protein